MSPPMSGNVVTVNGGYTNSYSPGNAYAGGMVTTSPGYAQGGVVTTTSPQVVTGYQQGGYVDAGQVATRGVTSPMQQVVGQQPIVERRERVVTEEVVTGYQPVTSYQPVVSELVQEVVTQPMIQQVVQEVMQPREIVTQPREVITQTREVTLPPPPAEIIERIVEVEVIKEVPVDRIVEVPVDRIVDRYVEVPVEKIVERSREVPVERLVIKEVPVEVEKLVEKVVVKEVPVPVEKLIEKIIEVPVEKIVYQDRIVYQDQVVYQDRVVEVPVERVVHYNAPREGATVATGQSYVVGMREAPYTSMYGSQRLTTVGSKQVGLGLLLRKNEQQQTCIKEIFSGYAASKSGRVSAGDVILFIDGRSIEGMDLENIKNLTIGDEGTSCTLGLLRAGQKFDISFVRCHPEGGVAGDARAAEVYRSLSRANDNQ